MKILKYTLSILFCNAYRLLRIIPNNDPIMSCMLPFAKQNKWWNAALAALFAFLTMVSFDQITRGIGIWTWTTACTYAALGLLFHFTYKRMKKVQLKHYLGSGVIGVLIFDFVTGVLFGPATFGMSYMQAALGQIPFTVMHLLTASGFVLILTPLLDRAIISNPMHYLGSCIAGIFLLDFAVLFGMNYTQALIGQIPFIAMYLLTASGFVLILTLLLDKAIISNPMLEDSVILSKFRFFARA